MEIGCVVRSAAGHDKDVFFMVTHVENETGYVYIADGKSRKLEKPKRKNSKHVRITKTVLDAPAIKTDKRLRDLLKPFNFNAEPGAADLKRG